MTDIAANTPEKMPLTSVDIAKEKRELLKDCLAGVFPEVMAEDKIDFDQLMRVLGEWVEPGRERFGLNWPGKAGCMKVIQAPSVGTLKPSPQESVDWDTTENLFIEGDNLEVLKLFQKAYFGKVKMIYIDPPYNTGKEFIYPDKYAETLDTYMEYTGQKDSEGRKFSTNTDTDGRFHSRWLNMMYPRLYLAKNLLSQDGIIFISIDDHEQHNLRSLCNEIFGEENLLAHFTWRTDGNIDNQAKVKRSHEYIIAYCRSEQDFPHPPIVDSNIPKDSKLYRPEIRNTIVKNGPKNPPSQVKLPKGFPSDFDYGQIKKTDNTWPKYTDDANFKGGVLQNDVLVQSGWSSRDLLDSFIREGFQPVYDQKGQETSFVVTSTGAIEAIKKRSEKQSHVLTSLHGLGGPQKAGKELEELEIVYDDYAKPTPLVKYLISMIDDKKFVVMDFFAGSGTTAHAVWELNVEDEGTRSFVTVQLPEKTRKESRAQESGYGTISQITLDRLKKYCEKKRESSKRPSDLGFRSFKLDRSCFQAWDGEASDELEDKDLVERIAAHGDHLDSSATAEDILFELLLKDGFPLTVPIDRLEVTGKEVFSIAEGALLICLDKELTQELIDALAEMEPTRVICLDAGFKGNDQIKVNAVETFKARARTKETAIEFRTV